MNCSNDSSGLFVPGSRFQVAAGNIAEPSLDQLFATRLRAGGAAPLPQAERSGFIGPEPRVRILSRSPPETAKSRWWSFRSARSPGGGHRAGQRRPDHRRQCRRLWRPVHRARLDRHLRVRRHLRRPGAGRQMPGGAERRHPAVQAVSDGGARLFLARVRTAGGQRAFLQRQRARPPAGFAHGFARGFARRGAPPGGRGLFSGTVLPGAHPGLFYFLRRERPQLADRQVAERDRPDRHPRQREHLGAQRLDHPAHLAFDGFA